MSKVTLKLSEITVLPQPRRQFRDIPALADDIREHGLLQPPTITPSKRLLMGERRFRACKLLGLESIEFNVYEKELTDDEILEIQVAENVARDDLTWQERALALLDIWNLKQHRGALEGWSWGVRQAAEMFKMSIGTVSYVLIVAKRLQQELTIEDESKRRYWQFDSPADAYRNGILAEEEDKWNKISAQQAQQNVNIGVISKEELNKNGTFQVEIDTSMWKELPQDGVIASEEAKLRYEANPFNTQPFEEYIKEKQAEHSTRSNTLYLSRRIIHTDSITYMNETPNFFDHIITDIPFGIDTNMLDQSLTSVSGIDRTADAHEVEENRQLHERFFKAAYKTTKDKAYVITFCDIMEFRRMVDLAEEAGFSCQRWPIIAPKTIAMNSSAHCNSTKNYEAVLICHKPGGTFINKLSSSLLPPASTKESKLNTGHVFAKPPEWVEILVNTISMEGQRILEPFAGGGSIVIKMLQMKREVFAVEKYEHQYNALLENVKREYFSKLNPNFIYK